MSTAGTVKAAKTEKDNFLITRFGALCFFLSAVECIIPKPLPFLRLGISNVPLIIAAGFFSPGAYSLLAFVKIIAQGMLGGTFFSWIFLFSTAGTAASASLMFLLKRALKAKVSAAGLSVAGAFASSLAQIAVARAWIFGESTRAIIPFLLGAGIISGLVMGIFAELFTQKSLWLSQIMLRLESGNFACEEKTAKPESASKPRKNINRRIAFAVLRIAAGFFFIIITGLLAATEARAAAFAASYAALCIAGKRPRTMPVLISLLAIVAFNLFPPRGAILAEIAGIRIAADSLRTGLSRAFFFEALIFISRWTFMPGKIHLPQGGKKNKKRGKAAKLSARIFHLLAETLELFGKLNSSPEKKTERRPKAKKLSLEGAVAYIDNILQRIDAKPASAAAAETAGKGA